jgi:hypothetical protein
LLGTLFAKEEVEAAEAESEEAVKFDGGGVDEGDGAAVRSKLLPLPLPLPNPFVVCREISFSGVHALLDAPFAAFTAEAVVCAAFALLLLASALDVVSDADRGAEDDEG